MRSVFAGNTRSLNVAGKLIEEKASPSLAGDGEAYLKLQPPSHEA
jgi:hypothetical protein